MKTLGKSLFSRSDWVVWTCMAARVLFSNTDEASWIGVSTYFPGYLLIFSGGDFCYSSDQIMKGLLISIEMSHFPKYR